MLKYTKLREIVQLTMNKLEVCEIFKSIQGESTLAGTLCSFVRLSGCNLSCTYCDTQYAQTESTPMEIDVIVERIETHSTKIVEITGGEPLLQKPTPILCDIFLQKGYTVLVETNGSCDIAVISPKCKRIVDIKCPSSGMCGSFLESNYDQITSFDELKFVISDKNDFDWAKDLVFSRKLDQLTTVIFSPNLDKISPAQIAEWIVNSSVPVRFGIQLHKIIWGKKRGV